MDHSALVEALKDPGFYPHPVERIEFIQTHISSVFLTGEYVYKLKKHITKLKRLPKHEHWKQLGSQAIQDVVCWTG